MSQVEVAPPKHQQDEHVESIEAEQSTKPAPASQDATGVKKDDALQLIEDMGYSTILTPENNKQVLRKIDLRLLPILLAIYFLQQLDKSTLSYASVFGLIEKAHLHGKMYSWLGSVVYLAQLVFQPLVSYLLVKVPLGKFLAVSCLLWGIALSCMTAANTFASLLVCRLFLGIFEAGIAPAFIAVTQMWYRRREQPVRLGSWYAMNGVVNMFGSLITYGLGHINSSIFEPYQIIFLFFGLITVGMSAAIFFFMPDSPITAKFLPEEDKLVAIERLRMNQQGMETHEWKWDHVKEAALDIKSWLWFSLMLTISIPSGGITTFGPLIVESFGFDQLNTILLNVPFGAVQLIATMGGAWLATFWKMKSPVLAMLCLPPIAGCSPLIYSWSAANTAGETKKKVTTGILIVGQCVGNVIGPTLYTTEEAPLYKRGLTAKLNAAYLFVLNKKHEKQRVAAGKDAKVVDHSMHAVGAVETDKEGAPVQQVVNDNAFKDLTDWANEDFVYVY
ncbi:unnamed protein product [Penicillium pancosmium]